jgi:anthranilate phosphoribosyltransferase
MISNNKEELLSPEKAGFERLVQGDLSGGMTVEKSAVIFMDILEGKGTIGQNAAVIANAGVALMKFHPEKCIHDCFEIARNSLKGGRALSSFRKLIENQ